ncbi:MAG TPA: hypothetical protein PKL68_07995, partial [Actinomycetota bacterium]|nr:hypothetical protein [Actinomycetota bacterium]HUM87561.1 hypothetical protein [Actinomycetota bacterium]
MLPPPAPHRRATSVRWGGDQRQDDFGWLAGEGADVLEALTAERAYYEQRVRHLGPLRDELAAEMRGLLPEADASVSFIRRDYTYLSWFRVGDDLPCLARRQRHADGPVEVLVDLGAVAAQEATSYAEFGVTEPGPGDLILA